MTHRLPYILSLSLVFGSLWLQGVLAMPPTDHDMTPTSTCLVSCLNMVHIDGADEAISTDSFVGFAASRTFSQAVPTSFVSERSIRRDSHHDPGRILTTIKRE